MRDGVEVALEVRVDYPRVPLLEQLIDPAERVLASPPRPEAVTVDGEVVLEDRFQHVPQCALRHPVAYRGNPQRAQFLLARFGDVHPLDRLRTIAAVAQGVRE